MLIFWRQRAIMHLEGCDKMTIYERIRFLREQQGMSQGELAEKLGYKSRSAINKIELGLRDISQSKVEAFANALGVSPLYLMGWDERKAPSQIKQELIEYVENIDDDEELLKILTVLKTIRGDKNE